MNKHLVFFYKNEKDILTLFDLRELADNEEDKIDKALFDISNLSKLYDVCYPFQSNYNDFLNFYSRQFSIINNNDSMNPKMHIVINETNRLLLNVLSALVLSTEHFKLCLDDKEKEMYKNKLSRVYDTSDNYAFIYKLRNYTIHKQLPISAGKLTKSTTSGNTSALFLNKKELLNNFNSWGTRVKPILESFDDFFEINSILDDCISTLENNVFKYFINKRTLEIEKSISFILNYFREVDNYCNSRKIVYSVPMIVSFENIISNSKNKNGLFNFKHFPFEFLQKIGYLHIEKIIH